MRTTFAIHLVAACAIYTLATGIFAQETTMQTKQMTAIAQNPSDPHAPVPAIAYRSVFKETSLGVEMETVDWRKANDDVGKFTRGHVDILKAEEMLDAKKDIQDKAMMTDKPAMKEPVETPVKPAMPAPNATKPIAAPAHKH